MRVAAGLLVVVLSLSAGAAFASFPPGVDTSNYQHSTSLNWSSVKASGVKFAFLKATEGSTFSDRYFAADWAATGRVGIYHGAYHFARPSIGSARAQARYFVGKIGPQKGRGTLPPVLDLEVSGGLSPSQLITWTHTFLTTVEQLTGRNPMIYVSPSFWRSNMANSTGFHDYPLWVANYGVSLPSVPGGWPTWSFWQTTSSGRISGISGNVDRDVFNGSMTQLQKFALAFNPIATALSLSASNPAPMSGQSVTFSGALLDSSGKAVAGKTVALAKQAPGSTTWAQVATTTTSSTGAYSFKTVVLSAAKYRTTFAGNSDLKSATSPVSSITLTPIPTAVTLTTSSSDALAGTTVTFSGALGLSATKPLAGKTVTLSRQLAGTRTWSVIAKRATDSAGAFSVPATMIKSASYRAQYAGDAVYAAATSPSQAVAVTLNPTTVDFHVSNTAPYVDQHVTMKGTLLNGTAPVAGRTVTLARQTAGSTTWATVGSATTDSTGHFSAAPLVDQPATYRAVFAGDSLYATSTSGTASLTITPPNPTRLTLRVPRTGVLAGELTTGSGQGLSGRTISVWKRLVGTDRWYRVTRTMSVAPSGAWRVSVGTARSCWFKAVFVGGPRYASAQSAFVRVNVR